jgi:hypothetical protein
MSFRPGLLLAMIGGCSGAGEDSGCPAEVPALEACFRGAAFAECGGDGKPTVGCRPADVDSAGECIWFTGGYLADGFEASCDPTDPVCEGGEEHPCWVLTYERGARAWDRSREMALAVGIDPTLPAASTTVHCTTCSSACEDGNNVCRDDDRASAALPGTLVVELDASGYLFGWRAEIEADLDASAARLCRLSTTDVVCEPPVGDPACATTGTLSLAHRPDSEADLAGLAGAVDATFADGLHIVGEFLIQ